jgi:predicted porin
MTVSLGGRLREYFFVADQDTAPPEKLNTAGQFTEGLIAAEAKTTLDNGITIRAYGRYDIVNHDRQDLNQAYIDIGTVLGRLRVGTNIDANTSYLGDPAAEAFLTADETLVGDFLKPRTGITLRDAFVFKRFTENAAGIVYLSPTLAGFHLGVSYHSATDSTMGTFDTRFHAHDAVDATVAYNGDFTGGTYRLAGGYFHAAATPVHYLSTLPAPASPGSATPSYLLDFAPAGGHAWNVAAGVTYGGWEIDGAYIDASPPDGLSQKAWIVGVLYAIGPWKLSTDYRQAMRDLAPFGVRGELVNQLQVQAAFKVIAGMSLGVTGFYVDQRAFSGVSYDSKGFLGGIKIDF